MRTTTFWRGLLAECRAFFEVLSIAFIVLILPWSLAFRVLRFLTRFKIFCAQEAIPACAQMSKYGFLKATHARRLFALHRLVDVADYFLTLRYGDAWLRKHCHVSGWPDSEFRNKSILFVTFHYGQGFWALRYLREKGFPVSWLHAPPPVTAPFGQKFSGWMGRRRIRQVAHLCGAPCIAVGGSVMRMKNRLLEEQMPVMAMPDAPLQAGQSSLPVTFFSLPAHIPAGTVRMAVQVGVPVVVYTMCVDPVDGRRYLQFEAPLWESTAETLAQRLCDHLQSAIKREPTAWHVWPWADGFFDVPGAAPRAPS